MESRTSNSIKNASFGISSYILTTVISFIARTIFIQVLGKTYLGISGLFNDILQLLALSELGIGTAITYAMYKPIANDDKEKVRAYMLFFKKIYMCIGLFVFLLGLLITPFLDFFISDIPDIANIKLIFMLYVSNTAVSYFFSYKRCLLNAYQLSRVNTVNLFVFQMAQYIIQSIVLVMYKDFIIYLLIQIMCTLASNCFVSIKTNKMFPELTQGKDDRLEKEEKSSLFKNVTALFSLKLSSAVVTSTDNILISKYVSTVILGVYSNYALITTMVKTLFAKIFEGLTGSIGNYAIDNTGKKSVQLFYNILFINYWLVSIVCIGMYFLIDDFISLWIGKEYILESSIVILIVINLFTRLLRNTMLVFIDAYGIFKNLKLKSISEAVANLVISLFLLKGLDMGVEGVLLGTFLSNMLVNFWWEPYALIEKTWRQSLWTYFKKIIIYVAVIGIEVISISLINKNISIENVLLRLFVKGCIVLIVVNIVNYLCFRKREEYAFLKSKITTKLGRK